MDFLSILNTGCVCNITKVNLKSRFNIGPIYINEKYLYEVTKIKHSTIEHFRNTNA